MAICMGLPDSSLRGFSTACAGRAADGSAVVARLRREMRCIEVLEKASLADGGFA